MQSHGFFPGRRSTDESTRANVTSQIVHRSNGDVIRSNDYRFTERREEDRRHYGRDHRHRDRSLYPVNPYHPQERITDANYEAQPRRVRPRDYTALYEDRSSWADGLSDLNLNGSKPILKNGISHARGERLYSSTLPRRSRTINFRDQSPINSLGYYRGYLKSLQDLSDLELDERIRDRPIAGSFLSSSSSDWRSDRLFDDVYRRRRYREDQLEDDYLRLYRSLSRLNKYPQGGRFEPGQVHYERECRTFGKDTVAFIYYKTCYL